MRWVISTKKKIGGLSFWERLELFSTLSAAYGSPPNPQTHATEFAAWVLVCHSGEERVLPIDECTLDGHATHLDLPLVLFIRGQADLIEVNGGAFVVITATTPV